MANWRRKRRLEDQARQEAAAAERIGHLMGFQDDTPPDPGQDRVGWATAGLYGSVKGAGHVCIVCSPGQPTAAHRPILRLQLAARQPCTSCGNPLERVHLGVDWGHEKK